MLKVHLLISTSLPVSAEDRAAAVRAAWRFAFGLMQPWSVNDNKDIGCDCPSPDVLLADCPWHGNHARRVCA